MAGKTSSSAIGAYLVDTGGTNVTQISNALRRRLGPAAQVTDIVSSRRIVGSSLTAVDLAGLTRVELGFAVTLAGASTGMVLWLGLAERRRTWAITAALGATPRQLGAFVWVEGALVAAAGLFAGALGGWVLSLTLVKLLSGVFDPPPSSLAVPWAYLAAVTGVAVAAVTGVAVAAVTGVAVAATAAAGAAVLHAYRRPAIELLRGL